MSSITITQAVIAYATGTTNCVLEIVVDVPTVGQTYVGRTVSLSSADLGPDWTDDQLCEAIAAKLGVPASDVTVAGGFQEAAAKIAAAAAAQGIA